MPNPKRRHSKRRTSTRRAHDFLTKPALGKCPKCHEVKQPHQACPNCGFYKGKAVQEASAESR
ncbi:MAG: 50S ribosomal protein L32 [Candidatus Acidiferrum sp.]